MRYFSSLIAHFLHYLMSCLSVWKGKWTNIDIGIGTGKVHQNVATLLSRRCGRWRCCRAVAGSDAAVAPLREVPLLSRRCGRWRCCRAVAGGGAAVAPLLSRRCGRCRCCRPAAGGGAAVAPPATFYIEANVKSGAGRWIPHWLQLRY